MTLNLALFGYGRMGKAIEGLLPSFEAFTLTSLKKRGDAVDLKGAHMIIDFSVATSVDEHLEAAVEASVPMLIGVTGLSKATHENMHEASKHIPLCYAPNTSIGIAVLHHLTQKAASLLGEYDIEILETHHKHKVDAPSGTAIHLGEAAALGRKLNLPDHMTYPHTKKRELETIGFSVMRGGAVVGDHHVNFLGEEDVITLTHRALNRDLFARGALQLALKLSKREKGFYNVADLLEL